jgi:hypothetical protein
VITFFPEAGGRASPTIKSVALPHLRLPLPSESRYILTLFDFVTGGLELANALLSGIHKESCCTVRVCLHMRVAATDVQLKLAQNLRDGLARTGNTCLVEIGWSFVMFLRLICTLR